jgi:hypothetical protein
LGLGEQEAARGLHKEELHNLQASPYIMRLIKSRRMEQVGYVACIGKMENVNKILVGNPEGKQAL